jgi:hypothetical protein
MCTKHNRKHLILLLITGLLVILFLSGCDNYQTIIYDNQTQSIIKPFFGKVSKNFYGNPEQEYTDPKIIVEAGQSKRFVEPISETKDNGDLYNYVVVVKNGKDETVFSRMFTWDELYNMDWRIIITEKSK